MDEFKPLAMGGDAARVMRRNIRPGSVSHAFINFPEPPHHSGDAAADNRHHLLTPGFFRHVHAALRAGGGLTLFSDNHRYMQALVWRCRLTLSKFTTRGPRRKPGSSSYTPTRLSPL